MRLYSACVFFIVFLDNGASASLIREEKLVLEKKIGNELEASEETLPDQQISTISSSTTEDLDDSLIFDAATDGDHKKLRETQSTYPQYWAMPGPWMPRWHPHSPPEPQATVVGDADPPSPPQMPQFNMPLPLQMQPPPPLFSPGSACLNPLDCHRRQCQEYGCRGRRALAEGRGWCSRHKDCEHGECSRYSNKCQEKPYRNGFPCRKDSECLSGRCTRALRCAPLLAEGRHCHKSHDCGKGRCVQHKCRGKYALSAGERCKTNSDCKGKKCTGRITKKCADTIKFCFDNGTRGSSVADSKSTLTITLLTGVPKHHHHRKGGWWSGNEAVKTKKYTKKSKGIGNYWKLCRAFEITDKNRPEKFRMELQGNEAAIINRAWFYKNGQKLQEWGRKHDHMGFCFSTHKKDDLDPSFMAVGKNVTNTNTLWKGKTYGKFCDKYLDFHVRNGRVYGGRNHWI